MNLSLSSKPLKATTPKTGTVAKVYTKDGRSIWVPLRPAQSTTCARCSQHPERQFMRWFTWQSAANPGFPVLVKSILLIGNRRACSTCQRQLTRFLNRYRLANRVRMGTLQPSTDTDQQRVSARYSWEFDEENDQELSRYGRSPSAGRSSATQRRTGAAKSPTSLRRRRSRSVVRILRRPPMTVFQNLVPIHFSDADPTYTTPSPMVEEPTVEEPVVDEPVADEPVADSQEPPGPADELSANGSTRRPVRTSASAVRNASPRPYGYPGNSRAIRTKLDQLLALSNQTPEDELEGEWYKKLAGTVLAGLLTVASPNDSVLKPIVDTTKAWVQGSKAEAERRRKMAEDAEALRKQAAKKQQEFGERRVLDELMAGEF